MHHEKFSFRLFGFCGFGFYSRQGVVGAGGFREAPFVFIQSVVVGGVDDGEFVLGEGQEFGAVGE